MSVFSESVLRVIAAIPKGRVTTYGLIAQRLGRPRGARLVGRALARSSDGSLVPCHRVVNGRGVLTGGWAFGHPNIMRQMLIDEGVPFLRDGRVDLDACLWDPEG